MTLHQLNGPGHCAKRRRRASRRLQLESLEFRRLLASTQLDTVTDRLADVTTFELSPNGEYAVYLADQDSTSDDELYSVRLDNGEIEKINSQLPEGGDIFGFGITPDSSQVVYFGDQDNNDVIELFVAPITGGENTKLSGPLVDGGAAGNFQITSDGSHVVYAATQDSATTIELYSVPISGGESTKISGPISSTGGVREFALSPDSSRVIYRADADIFNVHELFTTTITTGGADKLHLPLTTGGFVDRDFEISPDGSRVVFRIFQEPFDGIEIFSVATNGNSLIRHNRELVDNGSVFQFAISSDSQRLVYAADQDENDVFELYSTPLTGGLITTLNGPLVENGDVSRFVLTPDGSHVAYTATQDTAGQTEVYGVSIGGGEAIKLNTPFGDDTFANANLVMSPDGSVIYTADQVTDNVFDMFRVPVTGGDVVPLTAPLSVGQRIETIQVTPDASRVVFRARLDSSTEIELYEVSAEGGEANKLNSPVEAAFGGVKPVYAITPDSGRVVFRADLEIRLRDNLHVSELGGVEVPPLGVASVATDRNGATVEFSEPIDLDVLNLYDSESAALGPADFVLDGATGGPVMGSLAVDSTGERVAFITAGTPLPPDNYTLRLRSGEDAFRSLSGELLDGDADGTAGGEFETTFEITALPAETKIVSLPDFVRGPGQEVNLPANSANGIPLSISDAESVRNATIEIGYDPTLLTITTAVVGSDMPDEASVELDVSTPGTALLTFTSPVDLPQGVATLVNLAAEVPADNGAAIFGRQQILDIGAIVLTDSEANVLPSADDDGLHVVSFFGDPTGNGRINAGDAASVARFAALLDGGFPALSRTQPRLIADISGNGRANAADASLIAQAAALIPVEEIPAIPAGALLAGLRLDIPSGVTRNPLGPQRIVDAAWAGFDTTEYHPGRIPEGGTADEELPIGPKSQGRLAETDETGGRADVLAELIGLD